MRISRQFLALCRTVHIYLTMFGLAAMLFFGVTGFTVNHEDWFGATEPSTAELEGQTPASLVAAADDLRIVEHLRQTFHITGALSDFDDLDDRFACAFKAPGQTWEIEVDKPSGETRVHHESFGWAAVANNLHRGRYSGAAWSWVIDVSAALIVVACLSGLVLWLALPKRRRLGIAALVVGTFAVLAIYAWWVPGDDIREHAVAPDTRGESANE